MKVNEVPEKIYLSQERDEDGCYVDLMWHIHPYEDRENILYVRSDAFIEKAKNWFYEHTDIPQEVETNEDGEPLADSYIKYAKARLDAANEMFENFKNYMKG